MRHNTTDNMASLSLDGSAAAISKPSEEGGGKGSETTTTNMASLSLNGGSAVAATSKPFEGGGVLENYTWTQQISDVTITTVVTKSSPVVIIKRRSLKITTGDSIVVLDQQLPHDIDVSASNWSVDESGEVLVDLCKKIEGFWECAFVDGPKIDIKSLGPKVGDVGKAFDPNEPVKIEDPDMIKKVTKEHPEIAASMAQMAAQTAAQTSTSGSSKVVTQSTTSATFTGSSSFSW